MNSKIHSLLLSLLLVGLMLVPSALALDVYVTKNGKKYHKKDSRFIKGKEVEKLTLEEAEARGYKPSREMLRILKEQTDKDQQ